MASNTGSQPSGRTSARIRSFISGAIAILSCSQRPAATARWYARFVLNPNGPSADAIPMMCMECTLANESSKIGRNVFAIFSSSARLSPSEPSMSERLMVNCKTAITFGRFASVGRIHWSEKVSTGSDCRSLATNKVSIIPHDAHPSTETNASI